MESRVTLQTMFEPIRPDIGASLRGSLIDGSSELNPPTRGRTLGELISSMVPVPVPKDRPLRSAIHAGVLGL